MYYFLVVSLFYLFFFCWFPTLVSARNEDGAVFGAPEDLADLKLPTILEVGSFFYFVKNKLTSQGQTKITNYYVAKEVMIHLKCGYLVTTKL